MTATKIKLVTELILADYTLIFPQTLSKVYLPEIDFELELGLEPGLYEIVTSSVGNDGAKTATLTVSAGASSISHTVRANADGKVSDFFQFIINTDRSVDE